MVEALRQLGHDVLTALEAGRANQGIADDEVLRHATGLGRAVLTYDRDDFHHLHILQPGHAGIITCTDDRDMYALAGRIAARITALPSLAGELVKVTKAA